MPQVWDQRTVVPSCHEKVYLASYKSHHSKRKGKIYILPQKKELTIWVLLDFEVYAQVILFNVIISVKINRTKGHLI